MGDKNGQMGENLNGEHGKISKRGIVGYKLLKIDIIIKSYY